MIKRFSSLVLTCMCSGLVVASTLFGEESNEKNHVPVGSRVVSLQEQVAQQENRAKLSSMNLHDDEPVAIQPLSQVKVTAEDTTSSDERVTNHSMFYTSHPGAFHRPYYISAFGDTIEFEDGSIWMVYSGDAYKLMNWLPNDPIVITSNHSWFSSYNFRLTNQNTGASVEANLTLGPIYNGLYTHWIVAIDYYYDIVYLEDGTVWNMSYLDDSIVRKWVVNDTVIIGINDSWLSSSKPNILINVNMLNYATGIVAY